MHFLSISLPTFTLNPLSLKVNKGFSILNKRNRNYLSHFWIYLTSWRTKDDKVVKILFSSRLSRQYEQKRFQSLCVITCTVQITRLSSRSCFPFDGSADKPTLTQKLPNDESLDYTSFSLLILCETEPQTMGGVGRISSHWNYTNELFHVEIPTLGLFFFRPFNFGAEVCVNKLKSDLV